MDELSLLEAVATEDAPAAVTASSYTPASDFTGSLDYIDSLASRSALALSQRDVANIATAVSAFDYMSPLVTNKAVLRSSDDDFNFSTDFRPLGDARRYHPEGLDRPPRALVRSAARVQAHRASPSNEFPPSWRNPLDPTRSPADIDRALRETERRVLRRPFAFRKPNQVIICLKRKIRRQIMHSMGFAGRHYVRRHYSPWSGVVC